MAIYAESFEQFQDVTQPVCESQNYTSDTHCKPKHDNVKIIAPFAYSCFAPELCLQHYVAVVSSLPSA
jgi:hypothetical protein